VVKRNSFSFANNAREPWRCTDDPAPGCQTISFGIQGHGGMLDVYCGLPKACYFANVFLM